MAKRPRSSFVEDVVGAAAKLPWPVGVTLAIIVFIGLKFVSGIESPTPVLAGEVGSYAAWQFTKSLSAVFQWLIPSLLLVGSVLSVIRQRQRRKIYDEVASANSVAALNTLSWREFELLVGDYFRRRGFRVVDRGGASSDGGIDLVCQRGNDEYIVQCKQWRAQRVGVVTVRELYGLVSANRAAGGFVVTSGTFTEEAIRFAKGLSIELIDGAKLATLISQLERTPEVTDRYSLARDRDGEAVPKCPRCQAEMVMRTARSGDQVGRQFWGCSHFPACRGTRSASSGTIA